MRIVLFSALIALLLAPGTAMGWGKGSGKVSSKDLVPKMSSEEGYSERYTFAVDLEDGGHVGVDFTISNLGWGSGHGAVQVRVNLPNQPKYKYSEKLDEGEWSYSKGTFGMKVANTEVKRVGDGFRIIHTGAKPFDLTFDNKMPGWKPGSGKIKVDGGYYQYNLIAPRADVSGTVAGKKVSASRAGYADHVATNVAPFDLATRFMRMRHYNGDIFVIWREITLTKEQGGKSLTWMMVGFKDEIVFSDSRARMREGSIKVDPKTKYRVPLAVQIDGKSGEDSVKFVARGKTYKRKDLLDDYGSIVKVVASAVSEPIQYTVDVEYQLQMTIKGVTATVSGNTAFVVDQLN